MFGPTSGQWAICPSRSQPPPFAPPVEAEWLGPAAHSLCAAPYIPFLFWVRGGPRCLVAPARRLRRWRSCPTPTPSGAGQPPGAERGGLSALAGGGVAAAV